MVTKSTRGAAGRAALRGLLMLHVLLVGFGVSMPAAAADDPAAWRGERERRSERRDRQGDKKERRGAPETDGERGHVRRRDRIERSTHVEKKEGWRRID